MLVFAAGFVIPTYATTTAIIATFHVHHKGAEVRLINDFSSYGDKVLVNTD